MRTCPKCDIEKDLSEFWKSASYCKPCMKAYKAAWQSRDRERANEYARRSKRKRTYGITEEEFQALIAKQKNRCAVCRQTFTKTPNIDHDHVTGKVRGLLCQSCNFGIGALKDDIWILKQAARYLALSAVDRQAYEFAKLLELESSELLTG